jgi:hypothetical protein
MVDSSLVRAQIDLGFVRTNAFLPSILSFVVAIDSLKTARQLLSLQESPQHGIG